MRHRPRRGGVSVAPAIAGIIIVALMIAGTIPVIINDAWLWGLLVLFIVSFLGAAGGSYE
jgi:ABC-type multidrug transport system permease subunit